MCTSPVQVVYLPLVCQAVHTGGISQSGEPYEFTFHVTVKPELHTEVLPGARHSGSGGK